MGKHPSSHSKGQDAQIPSYSKESKPPVDRRLLQRFHPARARPGRFSTIVENSVENSRLSRLAVTKSLIVPGSAYGEGPEQAIFPLFLPRSARGVQSQPCRTRRKCLLFGHSLRLVRPP